MLQRYRGKTAIVILSLLLILLAATQADAAGLLSGDDASQTTGGQVHDLKDISLEQAAGELAGLERPPSAGLEYIFEPDDRQQVTNTTQHPYNKVVYLEAWKEGFEYAFTCSGSFVSVDVILTAAHCVWIPDFGGWPDGIAVVPGKNGNTDPYGWDLADNLWVPDGWIQGNGDINSAYPYDYALIKLPDADLGNAVGNLTMGILQTNSLTVNGFNPTTAGYPGDKTWGTQWTASDSSFIEVGSTLLRSEIDIFQGQSGSAVWRGSDEAIVGVMSFEDTGSDPGNYALRLTEDVLDDFIDACQAMSCSLSYFVEGAQPTATSPAPTATSPPVQTQPPAPTQSPPGPTATSPNEPPATGDTSAFDRTWSRTDKPVADLFVDRTWIWGPSPFTDIFQEPYADAPGGQRTIIYHEKSRMEINDPGGDSSSIWYITNGLLAQELITGRLQTSDDSWVQFDPAQINIAGDPTDPDGPTYQTFLGLLEEPALAPGAPITATVNRAGQVGFDQSLAAQNVTAAYHVAETGHTVASVFWEFMNAEGLVYENGGLANAPLFENAFFATGLPTSEAYWATVEVGGVEQLVLIQAFERRVLTYTPGNPPGWTVEAGNVGLHYYDWRYQVLGQSWQVVREFRH